MRIEVRYFYQMTTQISTQIRVSVRLEKARVVTNSSGNFGVNKLGSIAGPNHSRDSYTMIVVTMTAPLIRHESSDHSAMTAAAFQSLQRPHFRTGKPGAFSRTGLQTERCLV